MSASVNGCAHGNQFAGVLSQLSTGLRYARNSLPWPHLGELQEPAFDGVAMSRFRGDIHRSSWLAVRPTAFGGDHAQSSNDQDSHSAGNVLRFLLVRARS